mgnify:CR=1 FL=1
MKDQTPNFQQLLIKIVEQHTKPNELMADVIADILDCSRDAAYRRIQGRTDLSFAEAVNLSTYFGFSLNAVQPVPDSRVVFNRVGFIKTLDDYHKYMINSLKQLEAIGQRPNHVMYYQAKDIPVYYQFGFKKLAAFKIYVWLKSVYNIQKINGQNYSLKDIPAELLDLAKDQWRAFSKLNTIEIWNDTTVLSMLKQLEYFYEAGLLTSQEEALEICDEFEKMMKLIYKQALSGLKVHPNDENLSTGASYKMYYHEILLMDNHIYAEVEESHRFYFLPYAGVNYLSTSDPQLTQDMRAYVIEQTKKSSLISDVSEKERNKFFIRIKNQINRLREAISQNSGF